MRDIVTLQRPGAPPHPLADAGERALSVIERQPWLDTLGDRLVTAIHAAFSMLGPSGAALKNALHGTWLGHPLHPVLTDVPIGSWTAALAFDAAEVFSGRTDLGKAADACIVVGLVGAVGAAVTGMTDWSETDGRARKTGLTHALLNTVATGFYVTSLLLRGGPARGMGQAFSLVGYVVASASAFLGGKLVYTLDVGPDHSAHITAPDRFVDVMAEGELPEGKLVKAEIEGHPYVLARVRGELVGVGETCSHLGGPLAEGRLEIESLDGTAGPRVRCPWHGSCFSMRDGSVVDGPATHAQPALELRTQGGRILARARKKP